MIVSASKPLDTSMTITNLRDDISYTLLKKIAETNGDREPHEVNFTKSDFDGRDLTVDSLEQHLEYLTLNEYINADVTGDNPPESFTLKDAELTEKGQYLLKKLGEKYDPAKESQAVSIDSKDMAFLEKVMIKGNIPDPFDARDITEVVFRVMRDLMTTEASDRVAEELHEEVLETEDKALQMEIADLWKDTNPIVGFLSRVRPPWQGPGIFKINDDRFLFRVANEGMMPPERDREQVVKAVFSATKDELSAERIQEIASWLPGKVRQLWEEA